MEKERYGMTQTKERAVKMIQRMPEDNNEKHLNFGHRESSCSVIRFEAQCIG